jgi:hypothetical protein
VEVEIIFLAVAGTVLPIIGIPRHKFLSPRKHGKKNEEQYDIDALHQ